MRFLIDEDVPVKLMKFLVISGHEAVRVVTSSSDVDNARRSKAEGRVLISLDKDFTNFSLFPPSEFNIIHINIHPPYADEIIEAIKKLFETSSPEKLAGLIILMKEGNVRISWDK